MSTREGGVDVRNAMVLVGFRILVVNADPELSRDTCRLLGQAGYQVSSAGNGAEALQHACARPPDLVLIDHILPDSDGVSVCHQIKAQPVCASVLVVLVLGTDVSAGVHAAGLESGVDGCLVRGVRGVEMLLQIETFARMARLNRQLSEETKRRRLLEIELDERVRLRTRELRLATQKPEEVLHPARGLVLNATLTQEGLTSATEALRGEVFRPSEAFTRKVLDSLTAHIAVLDKDGTILTVNQSWRRFAEENGGVDQAKLHEGANYLATCVAAGGGEPKAIADDVLCGIRSVMARHQPIFAIDYACHSDTVQRWFRMTVVPFCGSEGGVVVAHESITERRLAEEALARSQAELKAIYDHAPVMLCVVDADRRVRYANRAFTAFTGVPEAALQDGHACGVFGCINALDDSRGCGFGAKCADCALRLALENTLNTGEVHRNVEYHTVLVREGQTREVTLLGSTALIDRDRRSALLLCLNDITPAKKAERALRESLLRNTALLNAIPDLMFVLSADGRFVDAKVDRLSELYALPSAFLGKGVAEVLPAEVARLTQEGIQKARSTGRLVQYTYALEMGGQPADFESRMVPCEDGAFLAIVRDITERKRAEEALRGSERALSHANALLQSIMESPPGMVIFALDSNFRYTIFTRAHQQTMRALWGFEIEVGTCMLEAISKVEDRENARRNFERALRGEHFIEVEEYGDPDHQRTYYEDRYGPVYGQDGRISGLTVFVTDVTERRRADEQLRLYSEQLRALSARVEELRETERTKIAREIHDELGQLLTGLKMDLRWIEHDLERLGNSPDVNPVLDRVVSATELVDATAKAVQRIAAELRPGILDKLGLVMALRYETRQFQQRTGITTQLEAPEAELGLPEPVATAVFRICQEALTNVARHAGATKVAVSLLIHPDRLVLQVCDNGKGITAGAIEHPASLGLLGIQERARQLGGAAGIAPQVQGGTLVTLELPRSAEHAKTT